MMVTRNVVWGALSVLTVLGCGGVSLEAAGSQGGTGGQAAAKPGKPESPSPSPGEPVTPGLGMGLGATSGGSESRGDIPAAPAQPTSYPGQGFIVHEWGTDTVVVGSDGSLQRGLQHEEEDLPAFVYDRLKAGPLLGKEPSVTIKMETPVTYFYSDKPLSIQASVQFPKGVLTQWFPAVASFVPAIAAPGAITPQAGPVSYADPVLDSTFPFVNETCREKFGQLRDGRLDWGSFSVLAPGSEVAGAPPAALDEFTWSYARAVASNPIAMPNGEAEKFLFYRGLGEFELPVSVTSEHGGKLTLKNGYVEAIPSVFVINVDAERGAFTEHGAGIPQGGVLEATAPVIERGAATNSFVEQLGGRVTAALDATGLYHDEAVAMVNTWKRQWFRTPGLRVLYVIPQSWTEASIPLSISPKPDHTLRVMLIRVELITPEQEEVDVAAAKAFETSPDVAAAHFDGLGRFEEPRLRRALLLAPSSVGSQYLASIQSKAAAALGE